MALYRPQAGGAEERVIITGDSLHVMAGMDACSIGSVVSDPPYGISLMGKEWDRGVPGKAFWVEAFRVAKPGAYLVAFGGSRTYHHLASAIEDAGWEIRDQLLWIYKSGYPKSLNVSKAIDQHFGAERPVVGKVARPGSTRPRTSMGDGWQEEPDLTAAATPEAKQWEGYGTAVKPCHEPIVLARKPLQGTVAENVLTHGVGALNIDDCRVGDEWIKSNGKQTRPGVVNFKNIDPNYEGSWHQGRWTANIHHDGCMGDVGDCYHEFSHSCCELHEVSILQPWIYCPKPTTNERDFGLEEFEPQLVGERVGQLERMDGREIQPRLNHHVSVKPIQLMRHLVRLVTPPSETVLDPFVGSGTTGIAAALEGRPFIGIELSEEYARIAEARIAAWSGMPVHYQAVPPKRKSRVMIGGRPQVTLDDLDDFDESS